MSVALDKNLRIIYLISIMTTLALKGDCLEVMKELPDASVDCFMCDLPFGILINQSGSSKKEGSSADWDIKINLEQFWTQVKRLCKSEDTPVIMFCTTSFGVELINSNPSWFRYDLVWNKLRKVGHLNCNRMPMRQHENIYIFAKKGAYYKRIDEIEEGRTGYSYKAQKPIQNSCYGTSDKVACSQEDGHRVVASVLNIAGILKQGNHPTEKPVSLYEWLLKRYCKEGGVVVDPTAGSFNSIIACKNLGLIGIGIEMNEKYFKKGCEKLGQEVPEV